MIVLCLDYGEKRSGVAVSDALGVLACPVTVIHAQGRDTLLRAVADIAEKRGAERVVLGLPRNMDGSFGEKARACEALAKQLEARLKLPVELWDERMSTVSAHRALNEANVRGQKRRNVVDAVAAVVILQSYLDRCRRC
ncbi:MAG: Holliday junction resolvase RuvX [Oscillospiraceae bacterium]|nr:Holliday junction resolvase RuvX [Oscillospiraceae bacterium]